jgi:lipoprotein-anchoring transpeptidase ErfK/SrfK
LGEWWIGLRHNSHKGFGIHGTNAPETIETASSLGCVRMLNAEVEEVAAIAHVGMPVRTVE